MLPNDTVFMKNIIMKKQCENLRVQQRTIPNKNLRDAYCHLESFL